MTNNAMNDPFEDLGGNPQVDEAVPGEQGRDLVDQVPLDDPRDGRDVARAGGRDDRRDAQAAPADGDVIGAGAPGPAGQIKDPEDWVTGDQPMTDAQRGYLDSLAKQAGETLPADLTKAEASEQIDRLQGETGRGGQPRS